MEAEIGAMHYKMVIVFMEGGFKDFVIMVAGAHFGCWMPKYMCFWWQVCILVAFGSTSISKIGSRFYKMVIVNIEGGFMNSMLIAL